MEQIAGRKVLITGGAAGIGLEMALRFAEAGAGIVVADRDSAAIEEALEMIRVLGVEAWGYTLDVTDLAGITTMRDSMAKDVGPIDILINNAGVVFGGPFTEVPLERHLATYRVNVDGVVAMTHAFLPQLLGRSEAHLVNISSASAFVGLPFGSTYASSKWAVLGFTESLRLELEQNSGNRVGVTAVCPSYIGTGMFDGAKPPAGTGLLKPEFIATRVLEAVLSNEAYVLEPLLVKMTPALKGILPGKVWDRLADALGASSSMESWRGHDSEPLKK